MAPVPPPNLAFGDVRGAPGATPPPPPPPPPKLPVLNSDSGGEATDAARESNPDGGRDGGPIAVSAAVAVGQVGKNIHWWSYIMVLARVQKQEYATVISFLWARCAARCLHCIIQLQSAHCGKSNTALSLWFEMNFRTEVEFTRQHLEIP